jgi:hypothetical protein
VTVHNQTNIYISPPAVMSRSRESPCIVGVLVLTFHFLFAFYGEKSSSVPLTLNVRILHSGILLFDIYCNNLLSKFTIQILYFSLTLHNNNLTLFLRETCVTNIICNLTLLKQLFYISFLHSLKHYLRKGLIYPADCKISRT